MKIAIYNYQMPKHQNLNAYFQYTEDCVKKAFDKRASLVVFPEYGSIELISLMSETIQKDLALQLNEIQKFREDFINQYQSLAKKYNLTIVLPSFPWKENSGIIKNRVYVVNNLGIQGYQEKNMMTRFENEEWKITKGEGIQKLFEINGIKFGINICYDVEFPDFAREQCLQGAKFILAPSCTENLKGMHRVHIGARARALENQCFVVVSQTTGDVTYSEAIDFNTGMTGVYATPDLGFPDDGIIFQSKMNEAGMTLVDLDFSLIEKVRVEGKVFNFSDVKNLPKIEHHR